MVLLMWASGVVRAGMPVVAVDFTVDIDGPLAEIAVEQVFVNDGDRPIEAVYVFPLHEQAAVDGMRIEVAGRVVHGAVEELQAATEAYEEAVDNGYVAALTTQSRPNMFTQYVGNIPPGEEVVVSLRVVQPVPHVDGAYELVLPLAVGPRFVPLDQPRPFLRRPGPVALEPGPMVAPAGTDLRVGIDVLIDSVLPFRSFESPSHEVAVAEVAGLARAVTTEVPADRDFVLRWTVTPDAPQAGMIVQDDHLVLTFEPPDAPPRSDIVPRELIWVIDQSGSMSGQPISMVRDAMLEALEHVDARDSLRILRFSNTVEGDSASRTATPQVLEEARKQIRALRAGGGTYMLDGVLAALYTPSDPGRERYVTFLTDGLIGNDTGTLATIADRVGEARLFAFGVGPVPNRYLLDEMARVGGGKTTWLRDGESPQATVQRFVDTIDKPVLSEITIDWGDWEVETVLPERLPALYAGQPMMVVGRVVHAGTADVVVRGRVGDGRFEQAVTPVQAAPGRAVPSTWARQNIRRLEALEWWGPVEEVRQEILQTSLDYQVMSQHTAFLAVDRSRVVNPGGEGPSIEQPVDTPHGVDWAEEIVVEARQRPVEVESTARGQVLTKEFLQRVPAGRSYQTAVTFAAGVQQGAGGNPNLGGGAYNENTYMLDGVNVTDPVTGTFSLNFNFDAIQQIEVLLAGHMPELPGTTGTVVNVVSASGTNNLETDVGGHHLQGASEASDAQQVGGQLSGPLVRDKVWLLGSYGHDRSAIDHRGFDGHTGFLKLTAQPTTEHRVSVSGNGSVARVVEDAPLDQESGLASGRWQWFLSPEVGLDTVASVQGLDVGGDRRGRVHAHVHAHALSVRAAGRHDLKAGVDVDRISWRLGADGPLSWLGVDVPPEAENVRGGVFAQDSYKPVSRLTLNTGVRVDATLGRAFAGPRLYGAWDPFGDQRTKIASGLGRRFGHLGLPTLLVDPDAGLSRLDEALLIFERELVTDLAIGFDGVVRAREGVPTLDGDRVSRRSWSTTARLSKVHARRWFGLVEWTYTELGRGGDAAVVDDGSLEGFAHTGRAHLGWDLPTDPWTIGVAAFGSVSAAPIGVLAPDPTGAGFPNAPRWTVGVALSQDVDVRKGRLSFELEGRWVELLGDPTPVTGLVALQTPVPDLVAWEGPRLQAGLRYSF